MSTFLLAAGWNDFIHLVPFIIAFLVWVIGRFAGQVAQKPPQRGAGPAKPGVPQPPKAADSLQTEIDQFLRQAQAAREGRTTPKPGQSAPVMGQSQSRETVSPSSGRPGNVSRQRPARPPQVTQAKRDPRRDEATAKPRPRPTLSEDVTRDLQQSGRGSVAQHVAETLDSSKFSRRATQLSQVQQSTDAEFQAHMDRVFAHDLGSLKKEGAGIFEAAGATANAASAAQVARANAAAAGAESGTAPVATRQRTSDIALFLAGRKNIRDAVILSEVLKRPEHRW